MRLGFSFFKHLATEQASPPAWSCYALFVSKLVVLLILAYCFKPNSVQLVQWTALRRHLVRPWGLHWAMNGSLCCSHRFWIVSSQSVFGGDTPCPTPSIWAAFDKVLLWYCHDCCFYVSPNRHGPLRPGHTHAHTHVQTNWNIDTDIWTQWYMSCTYRTVHHSGSCSDRRGFGHFMLSRNLTRMHMWPVCTPPMPLLLPLVRLYKSHYVLQQGSEWITLQKCPQENMMCFKGCWYPGNHLSPP